MHLLCEKVAADNLYIRRLILGKTLDETASAAGVSPEIATRYEAGKEKNTGNTCEFATITMTYGYNSSDINEIFLYGASADHNCLYSKKGLTFAPNPFSAAIENLT